MTIDKELEARILRLHLVEGWRVGTIATQAEVHHSTVERVLKESGLPVVKQPRPSMADPFIPFIVQTLQDYPKLPASVIHSMVQNRGYKDQTTSAR